VNDPFFFEELAGIMGRKGERAMLSRKSKILALLVICLGLGFFAYRFVTPKPQVNRESYEKIQIGMTMNEVQDIFQAAPGDYSTGPVHLHSVKQIVLAGIFPRGEGNTWRGDDGEFTVWFDNQGVVTFKWVVPGFRAADYSFIDKLRRWLGF
jgi:hypothetical protein